MSTPPIQTAVPGGYREVIRLAWPLVISMGSFTVMQFADRMFLAWYSATSLQAALPAGILSFTMICGFMALAGYANTFVAQYHGAGDPEGCSRATAQSVWLALLSWPLLLALIPVGCFLLRTAGHEPEVLEQELIYYRIMLAGGVLVPLGAGISSFFTGRGDTYTNMVVTVIGNVVNLVLDYLMIFGKGGFPAWGIRGAAYATIIASLVPPFLLFCLYFSPRMRRTYGTWRTFRLDLHLLLRIVRFGLPSGIHMLLDISSFTVFVLLTGRMGALSLAVSNIALSINMVAFLPMIGIGIAAGILVGQYQGRGDSIHAEKAGWTSLKLAMCYMTVIGLTYLLLPGAYFSLFTERGQAGLTQNELMPIGRYLLMLMAVWGLLDAANVVLSGALKGAGDTRFVMLYSVAMAWCLLVPVQLALVLWCEADILVLWAWLTIYVILLSWGYTARYASGRWKAIQVIEKSAAL